MCQPGRPRPHGAGQEAVRGVASVPGLYFLGLLWQHSQASASLVGPGLDAPYLVEALACQALRRAA